MTILTAKQAWRRNPIPERKWGRSFLTEREQTNVRRAVKALVRRGNLTKLCADAGISRGALAKASQPSRRPSPRIALAVAKIAGVAFDDILTGAWPVATTCPRCGGCGYVRE